jgi:hypothetical protein
MKNERECYVSCDGFQFGKFVGSPEQCRDVANGLLKLRLRTFYEIIDFNTGEMVEVVGSYPNHAQNSLG